MIDVIPLKYGSMFKRAFGDPEVFTQFVKDVLGLELRIDKVHAEYEYPKPVGFVRSQYDLFAEDEEQRIIVEIQQVKEEDFFDRFLYYHLVSLVEQVGGFDEYGFDRTVYTIVLLTSLPRDGSVDFSCAVGDMNPVDEHGRKLSVYPHRLMFLCPRLINERTPPGVSKWLEFIEDSLDGKMEENYYRDALFQKILKQIHRRVVSPELLAEIKDEAAWEKAKQRFLREGREDGWQEGVEAGEKRKARDSARRMRNKGYSAEDIFEITGLKPEDYD